MTHRDHLRALLKAHTPGDADEASHRERMLALVDAAEDCFSRQHFTPGHFTASAFILSPDRCQVLLIFHSKLQRWLQPGGHVEASDATIIDAGRREIAEEVGLSSLRLAFDHIFDVDIHMIPARKNDPAHEHFDVRFAFVAPDLGFHAGDDAVSARWVALNDVSEETSDRSVMRAVEKLKA
jgi:8-oxo-dGTP pyrophosphatase MutT (NUDIX family)